MDYIGALDHYERINIYDNKICDGNNDYCHFIMNADDDKCL